jgi:hypothetical protein
MTTYYGNCDQCGEPYYVEATAGPGEQMVQAVIVVVCQRHHPVGEAECVAEFGLDEADRKRWRAWRQSAEVASTL